MKFLVTGGAGFIGRWVVKELLEREHEVIIIDNFSNSSKKNIKEFQSFSGFEFINKDVVDKEAVSEIFSQDLDICIHLASKIDVQESLENPQDHFENNVIGTQNILELSRENSVSLTLVGTCMVYDMAESEQGISENNSVEPKSPYAGSKLAAENLAMSYYHAYDLPVTVVRPFNTYGPYQKTNMEGGVVSIFVDRDIRNKDLKVFGTGNQTRDLMYVTDTAEFIIKAALSEKAKGEIINGGTGRDISINDLAELVATQKTDIEHVEHHHPQSEIQKLLCDPSKAKDMLNWEPKVSLEEGIQKLREWMKERKDG